MKQYMTPEQIRIYWSGFINGFTLGLYIVLIIIGIILGLASS